VLANLQRRAELVRANVISPMEDAVGRHQAAPIAQHFSAYLAALEAAGCCAEHCSERRRQLHRLAADCGFATLVDLDRGVLERWLVAQARAGMGARTHNSYLTSAIAFGNWCCEPGNRRLAANPFARMPKANEKADPRRQRRAMVEGELLRLLAVARERPLLDALTVRKGPRKGERYAQVRPEVRERLQLVGRERALIYKTLVLTGLRKGELASLTAGQLSLDGPTAFLTLDAADEKNREGSAVPLRTDLAADLREWLADKLSRLQEAARSRREPIPARLPAATPVFNVPDKLCKILSRDLLLAGIPKRDERGRTLDVHALRHTFGTLMSKGGVAPRTAQAAMRHSKIDLTMSVYTDPKLLDVRGALDVLPELPLEGRQEAARASGTEGPADASLLALARALAPTLAPTPDNLVQAETIPVLFSGNSGEAAGKERLAVSSFAGKGKHPLAIPVSGCQQVGATGLEPVTPSVSKGFSQPPKSQETLAYETLYTFLRPLASAAVRLQTLAKNCGNSAAGGPCAEEARKNCGRGGGLRRGSFSQGVQPKSFRGALEMLRPGLFDAV
jgi:integrase